MKETFFDGTPENFLSKEGISKIFSTPRKYSQWKFLHCLGLLAGAGGENCPLLQATVFVKKLGPPLAYRLLQF